MTFVMGFRSSTMKPILFRPSHAQAIRHGFKTQTRRVVKNPGYSAEVWDAAVPHNGKKAIFGGPCYLRVAYDAANNLMGERLWPFWNIGDVLWVKTSLYQPRSAATLFLRVEDVRVERLQAITEADAVAEGCDSRESFIKLWDSINAKRGYPWASKPWVWVLSFKKEIQ